MKIKGLIVAAVVASFLLLSYQALAQWEEDEEQERLEDQQRDEVLYQDSDAGVHDESIHMPKKKQPPPPPPEPGKPMTPVEEIEGTSVD